jgi:hypothetical protein
VGVSDSVTGPWIKPKYLSGTCYTPRLQSQQIQATLHRTNHQL